MSLTKKTFSNMSRDTVRENIDLLSSFYYGPERYEVDMIGLYDDMFKLALDRSVGDDISGDDVWIQHVDKNINKLNQLMQHELDVTGLNDVMNNLDKIEYDWSRQDHGQLIQEIYHDIIKSGCTMEEKIKGARRAKTLAKMRTRLITVKNNYMNVFRSNMVTGCGIGAFNEPKIAKYTTFIQLMDYLSLPLWTTPYNETDSEKNPFLFSLN